MWFCQWFAEWKCSCFRTVCSSNSIFHTGSPSPCLGRWIPPYLFSAVVVFIFFFFFFFCLCFCWEGGARVCFWKTVYTEQNSWAAVAMSVRSVGSDFSSAHSIWFPRLFSVFWVLSDMWGGGTFAPPNRQTVLVQCFYSSSLQEDRAGSLQKFEAKNSISKVVAHNTFSNSKLWQEVTFWGGGQKRRCLANMLFSSFFGGGGVSGREKRENIGASKSVPFEKRNLRFANNRDKTDKRLKDNGVGKQTLKRFLRRRNTKEMWHLSWCLFAHLWPVRFAKQPELLAQMCWLFDTVKKNRSTWSTKCGCLQTRTDTLPGTFSVWWQQKNWLQC